MSISNSWTAKLPPGQSEKLRERRIRQELKSLRAECEKLRAQNARQSDLIARLTATIKEAGDVG